MKLMSAESVHKVLADKVHQHWTDLAKVNTHLSLDAQS